METRTMLIIGAAVGAVLLGMFGLIDGDTLRAWLPVIYGDATGAE